MLFVCACAVATAFAVVGKRTARKIGATFCEVHIPDLPTEFDGFTICHISDFHFTKNDEMAAVLLEILNDEMLRYDIICATGDYAYSSLSVGVAHEFFAKLKRDVYAVNGNSDIRQDRVRAKNGNKLKTATYFKDAVTAYLVNENVKVERGESAIYLAGVDEVSYDKDDLKSALESVNEEGIVVLLAHNPEIMNIEGDARVKLILSGHTHGGQLCLPNGQAVYNNTTLNLKYSNGLHEVWEDTVLVINRGIGTTRLRLRFNCTPEVSFIKLMKK